MANFAVSNSTGGATFGGAQVAMGATYKTLCLCAASTQATNSAGYLGPLRRGKVYDVLIGTNGAPVDAAIEWDIVRATITTVAATFAGSLSSASSTIALDPADVYVSGSLAVNSSVETQATQVGQDIWYVGVNSRASYRWVAAPGSELVYPAVSSNGFLLRARNTAGTYTSFATGSIMVSEQ
jgi:hypothetical protein